MIDKYVYRPILNKSSDTYFVEKLQVLEEGKIGNVTFYFTDDGDYGQAYFSEDQVYEDPDEAKQILIKSLEEAINMSNKEISRYLEVIEELNDY